MRPVKVVLIRHSEPDPSRGDADPSLSEAGCRLATATGTWLTGDSIVTIYCSPTRRASQTAELIAEQIGAPVIRRSGLAEFGGEHEYVPVEQLRQAGDARWAAMAAGDLAPFGTDAATFRAEVTSAIEQIVDAHPGETVAVVTHAGVINAYLGGMLGIDRLLWVELDYAGICRVAVSRAGVRSVLSLNERVHGCGQPATCRPADAALITPLPGGSL